MEEYRYYEDSRRQNEKKHWWQDVERMQFLVPNLLMMKLPVKTFPRWMSPCR